MSAISIVLSVIIIVGVSIALYFAFDQFNTYKTEDTARLTTETNTRASNVKSIVDQVNAVNKDIAKTTGDKFGALEATDAKIRTGLDAVFKVGASGSGGAGANTGVSLLEMPGSSAPDLQTIVKLTALSGMSMQDLGKGERSFKACFSPEQCIEIPDAAGNTVFRSRDANSAIVMSGTTKFQTAAGATSATFAPMSGQLNIDAPALYVGSSTGSATALMHVHRPASSSQDAFKVTVEGSSGDALTVNRTGDVLVQGKNIGTMATEVAALQTSVADLSRQVVALGGTAAPPSTPPPQTPPPQTPPPSSAAIVKYGDMIELKAMASRFAGHDGFLSPCGDPTTCGISLALRPDEEFTKFEPDSLLRKWQILGGATGAALKYGDIVQVKAQATRFPGHDGFMSPCGNAGACGPDVTLRPDAEFTKYEPNSNLRNWQILGGTTGAEIRVGDLIELKAMTTLFSGSNGYLSPCVGVYPYTAPARCGVNVTLRPDSEFTVHEPDSMLRKWKVMV